VVTGKSKVDKELCTLVDYYNEQLRLLNKHKTPRISQDIRDRPFNLKGGGYGFLFRSEIFFRTTRNVFPEFHIRLYDKNSESDYFCSSTKIRIFFSATLGIRIFF
jgi:hypothetical protein